MEQSFSNYDLEKAHKIAQTLAHFYQQKQEQFKQLDLPFIITLEGELGVGKTTFCRYFIQAIYPEATVVNSPTFNILHTYSTFIFHTDCYRLTDSEELEYLNIRENLCAGNVFLVEWASKVGTFFHQPFIEIKIYHNQNSRLLTLDYPKTQCGLTKHLQSKLNQCFVNL